MELAKSKPIRISIVDQPRSSLDRKDRPILNSRAFELRVTAPESIQTAIIHEFKDNELNPNEMNRIHGIFKTHSDVQAVSLIDESGNGVHISRENPKALALFNVRSNSIMSRSKKQHSFSVPRVLSNIIRKACGLD